jgi:hypothetical protein
MMTEIYSRILSAKKNELNFSIKIFQEGSLCYMNAARKESYSNNSDDIFGNKNKLCKHSGLKNNHKKINYLICSKKFIGK